MVQTDSNFLRIRIIYSREKKRFFYSNYQIDHLHHVVFNFLIQKDEYEREKNMIRLFFLSFTEKLIHY